ncbi:hypothetical protein B0H66DRAFT_11384 [Apodospora peruviana]|uniref:Zn(2)-C6 fungal-type domain-containing protein n=1 Tax=Apodospora peruviana TaxID=516989 RepID=A0AAE0MFF0_9PEZI|nr:hypothetical protein B0H66DRAFT_11384 [Apodospora peruviana]
MISVVASGELDDDVQMIDSGPESPQPQVVWPTLSGIKPPLLQTIELTPASVETYGASLHSTQNYMRPQGDSGKRGGSSSTTRHPASSPSGVRSRTLRHPEDTNEVRKKGACYRCRISRVKCNTDEPCHKCNIAPSKPGGEFVRETCIRDEPSKVGGVTAVHERWSWNEPLNLRRDDLKKASRGFLLVRFEDTPNGPFLKVATNSFTRPDRESNGSSLYDIIPNEGPAFDDDICNWAKNQILFENKQDFESCHEKLLQSYVETNGLQKAPRDTQTKLLEKVLRMRCMWKVWSCERFVIRTADDSPLPGSWDVSVVQDYLHRVAEQALSIVEKNILADLDKYLSPISPGDTKANISMYIAMWMILWQMILLYRQSLERTLRHQELRQQQPNAAPFVLGMNAASSKRYKFREVTEKLYNAVVVMYSELFRTRKVLEGLKDAGVNEFGNDSILYRAFRETWKARDSFYRQIDEDRGFHHNGLLGSLVVDKEKAAFKKGRGHKANV